MAKFSNTSLARLMKCHPDLKAIMFEAIELMDFSVLCGFRGKDEQEEAFRTGHSKKHWPMSKHNKIPSLAVDIAPYPIDWSNTGQFEKLADVVKQVALSKGIKIRWGGDFKSFKDYPHFELVT